MTDGARRLDWKIHVRTAEETVFGKIYCEIGFLDFAILVDRKIGRFPWQN